MPANQLALDLGGTTDLELLSIRGHEELSRPFEFQLEVRSPRDLPDLKKLATPATFSFVNTNGVKRVFHGLVAQVRRFIDHDRSNFVRYELTVAPKLAFLKFNQDCRIFQGKTALEVFHAVAEERGVTDIDDSNVHGNLPTLDYCVQYRESDFDFLSRLLEENGIFYFFRHEEGKHTMVLGDGTAAYEPGGADLVFSAADRTGQHVHHFTRGFDGATGETALSDYDPAAPINPIRSNSRSVLGLNTSRLSIYDYPGRFSTKADGDNFAKLRMEEQEAEHDTLHCDGNVDSLAVGRKFSLDDSFAGPEGSPEVTGYVCTSIDHGIDADSDGYVCVFDGIPDGVVYRPPRITPMAMVHGPQTAIVVGPSGEEIHTDELGRIKVQFHWDRTGQNDENSSCFVRVQQPIAGNGFGFQFLPRIGHEVVVQFLEGDPDRPLVTGSVYNSQLAPPYALPGEMTKSGIRTHSTKEGGADNFNEICFEDKKGEEKLSIQAEKDMARKVKNDDALTVGNDQTITIEGNRTEIVDQGDECVTIKKGKRTVTVSEGDDVLSVDKGDRSATIGAGADNLTVSKGNRSVEISMGNDTLAIKMGDQSTKLDLGKSSTEAMQSIEFKVGQSSIKIDPMGVTIKGMMISVEGQVQTDVKGLMVSVSADAIAKVSGAMTMVG